MHLSLDTMSMVDDSCLSSNNFNEMGKGGGVAVGGRVHSIDVILGFSKDQDSLLSPSGAPGPHKVHIDGLAEPGKQQEPSSHPSYSGHLASLRNGSSEQQQYHGEWSCSSWLVTNVQSWGALQPLTFKTTISYIFYFGWSSSMASEFESVIEFMDHLHIRRTRILIRQQHICSWKGWTDVSCVFTVLLIWIR